MTPSGSLTASRPVILVTDDTAELLALEARANASRMQAEIILRDTKEIVNNKPASTFSTTNSNGRSHKEKNS